MITINQLKEASFDVRQRAKRTKTFQRFSYVLVAPHDESKALRLVTFNGETIICAEFGTGKPCEANDHGRPCYHALAANRRREINEKRRATLRRKQAA